MQIDTKEIQVKIVLCQEKDLKAIISLNFGDFVIRGFRLRVSKFKSLAENENQQEGLWLTPPTYQSKGRYHPIFYVPDVDLWKKIEKKVLREYHKASTEVKEDDLI